MPGKTLLDHLRDGGVETQAVGKIGSIFNEQGIDVSHHDAGNPSCMARTLAIAEERGSRNRFVFVNLVDTDMVFGHRRDPQGYHDAVAAIDAFLPQLEKKLHPGDLILVTGDHGCDPTFKGTDHTREHVPLLVREVGSPESEAQNQSLGLRSSFADLSASVQKAFGLRSQGEGQAY